eukprot:GEMP01004885.1.p1 GENE.GEMP01004885.1~~GEMP01004885.1.p1  ORF type:complete len:1027 (+),score=206.26 GEMP01004885.1:48-3128(+)
MSNRGILLKETKSGRMACREFSLQTHQGQLCICAMHRRTLFTRQQLKMIMLTNLTIEDPRDLTKFESNLLFRDAPGNYDQCFDLFLTIDGLRRHFVLIPIPRDPEAYKNAHEYWLETWYLLWRHRDENQLGRHLRSTVQCADHITASASPRQSTLFEQDTRDDFCVPLELTCPSGVPKQWDGTWWDELCIKLGIPRSRLKVLRVASTYVQFTIGRGAPAAEYVWRNLKVLMEKDSEKQDDVPVDSHPGGATGSGDLHDAGEGEDRVMGFKGSFLTVRSGKGVLEVRVIKAKDLRVSDWAGMLQFGSSAIGSSDPYCMVHVPRSARKTETRSTKVVSKCLNPSWDEVFSLECDFRDFHPDYIVFDIWDRDINADDFLGRARMDIPFRDPGAVKNRKLTLVSQDDEMTSKLGDLYVEALWIPESESESETRDLAPPLIPTSSFRVPPQPQGGKVACPDNWVRTVEAEKNRMVAERDASARTESTTLPSSIVAMEMIFFCALLLATMLPSVLVFPVAIGVAYAIDDLSRKVGTFVQRGFDKMGLRVAEPEADRREMYSRWLDATWINAFLYQLWPYVLTWLAPQLQRGRIKIDIGPKPPVIQCVAAENHGSWTYLDLDLRFYSAARVQLFGCTIIRNVQLGCTLRLELGNWLPMPPMVGKVNVSLLSPPVISGASYILAPLWPLATHLIWWNFAWPVKFPIALVSSENAELLGVGQLTAKLLSAQNMEGVRRRSSIARTPIFLATGLKNTLTGGWTKWQLKVAVCETEQLMDVKHPKELRFSVPMPYEAILTLMRGKECVGRPQKVSLVEIVLNGVPVTKTFSFESRDSGHTSASSSAPSVIVSFCWFGSKPSNEVLRHYLSSTGNTGNLERASGVHMRVYIEGCHHLSGKDRNELDSSYARLRLVNDGNYDAVIHRTKEVKGTLSPSWFETFDFAVHNVRYAILEIVIYSGNSKSDDDVLGCASIPVLDIAHKRVSNIIALDDIDEMLSQLVLSAELDDGWRDALDSEAVAGGVFGGDLAAGSEPGLG